MDGRRDHPSILESADRPLRFERFCNARRHYRWCRFRANCWRRNTVARALNDAHGVLREVSELVLVDMTAAQDEPWLADIRVSQVVGDVADRAVLTRALTPATGSIFHLAAVVSGQAEADFDIGMRVNVDATRTLLELTRGRPATKFVFTSSIAVFGGNLPAVLPDDQRLTPQGSYGAQRRWESCWSAICRGAA